MLNIERYQKNTFLILFVFLFILLLYFTQLMSGIFVPVVFAFFTAMFLHPFIKRLSKTGMPIWLSIVIVYFLFVLIIVIILSIIFASFTNFISDLPKLTDEIRKNIVGLIMQISNTEIIKKYFFKEDITKTLLKLVSDAFSIDNINNYIIKPVGVTLNILSSFGLYVLFLIFIIPGMNKISTKVLTAFPGGRGNKINKIIMNINEQIQAYIVAKSLISLITGTISFLICFAFGIKYALLWGTVVFLFNFIPYIGATIAVIFPLMLCIIQFQSAVKFTIFAVILISIQFIMGNFVEPKFISRSVNLSPLVIVISLLIWGYLWGIAGVVLAVPIMSALNLIFDNIETLKPISVMISIKENGK